MKLTSNQCKHSKALSFKKPIVKKSTTKMRANIFGFYAINGESVVDFKEKSKKESVCEFLEKIREKQRKPSLFWISGRIMLRV